MRTLAECLRMLTYLVVLAGLLTGAYALMN